MELGLGRRLDASGRRCAGGVAPTPTSIWDWIWKAGSTGDDDGEPHLLDGDFADAQTTPYGSWTWNWTWVLAGRIDVVAELAGGMRVQLGLELELGLERQRHRPRPASGTSTAPSEATTRAFDPATDDGPVTQTNSVSAEATASVEFIALAELDQTQTGADPKLELQDAWADQRIVNAQTAVAVAEAAQNDAWNLNFVWGVPVESVLQSNDRVGTMTTAGVTARMSQGIVQEQNGNDTTDQSVSAEQWASNSQLAQAAAQAAQTSPAQRERRLRSEPEARRGRRRRAEQQRLRRARAPRSTRTITQWIGQFEDGGVAIVQEADATQLQVNAQDGDSVSAGRPDARRRT